MTTSKSLWSSFVKMFPHQLMHGISSSFLHVSVQLSSLAYTEIKIRLLTDLVVADAFS